jgi:hypothetical protein
MKRLIVVTLLAFTVPAATAQLYKYTDKDGKTVYSDQPPANVDSKQLKVQGGPSAPSDAPPKSAVARDKELEKGRKEAKDAAKKAEDGAARAKDQEERCAAARSNYQVYNEGQRLMKRTESGERVFLDDDEIAAEKEKARQQMDKACAKT